MAIIPFTNPAFPQEASLILSNASSFSALNPTGSAGKRFALVIGNSGYTGALGILTKPAQDAKDMKAMLEAADPPFQVTLKLDVNRTDLLTLLDNLSKAAESADVVLFYYSGHGVMKGGESYLVPINANIDDSESMVQDYCVGLARVGELLSNTNAKAQVIISDACRDTRTLYGNWGKAERQYRQPEPLKNVLTALATSKGDYASEGTSAHSVFTEVLLKLMGQPGKLFGDIVHEAQRQVATDSGGDQTPTVFGTLGGNDFTLTKAVATGSINIVITNSDKKANVWLDDKEQGETKPASNSSSIILENVRTGSHLVKIEIPGKSSQTQQVSVKEKDVQLALFDANAAVSSGAPIQPLPPTPPTPPDNKKPTITLKGPNPQEMLQSNFPYFDPGWEATVENKGDLNALVQTSQPPDTKTPGKYTITYSVTYKNETVSVTRDVIVKPAAAQDTAKPVVTLKGDPEVTVEQNGAFTDPGATAKDEVDGELTVSAQGKVDTSKPGFYTITYTATDKARNTGTAIRKVVVKPAAAKDITKPAVTLKGDPEMTVEQNGKFTDPGATAKDEVDGELTVSTQGKVDTSKPSTYMITYTATDKAGNTGTANRTVTVKPVAVKDTTKPVVTLKGAPEITIEQNGTFTDPGATAKDDIDGELTVSTQGKVDTSRPGFYTIKYIATDKAQNAETATRKVVVKPAAAKDITKPAVTLKGDPEMTVEQNGTFTDPGATAKDEVDGELTVSTQGKVDTSKPDTYMIYYTATDKAGNTGTANRTVTVKPVAVKDTTKPVVTLKGDAETTIEQNGTFTDPGATAKDEVDGELTVSTQGKVDTSKPDTYMISYTATDKAGNTGTANRTVTVKPVAVKDTTKPVVTLKGDAETTIEQNGTFTDPGATAKDEVDGELTVSTRGKVDTSKPDKYLISYTATDRAGNTGAANRTVTVKPAAVKDTTKPVVTLKGDPEMTVGKNSEFQDPGATAKDEVDGELTVSTQGKVDTSKPSTYMITYTATDRAGNTGTVKRTVTVTKKSSEKPEGNKGEDEKKRREVKY